MNVTSMQLTQLWRKEETEKTYFPYIHFTHRCIYEQKLRFVLLNK